MSRPESILPDCQHVQRMRQELFDLPELVVTEEWIEQTLLEAVAEERDPEVLLGFLATVGEIAAQRNGYEFLAEEIKENE